jgi:protein O-GlcNAc transferase
MSLRLDQADALIAAGQTREAIPLLRRAVQSDPRSARAAYLLGSALFSEGLLDQAEFALARAHALDPARPEAAIDLSAVRLALGKPAPAAVAARAALALDPDNTLALANLGVALANTQQTRESEAAFRRALALTPRNAPPNTTALTGLAQLLITTARPDEGFALARRAAELAPDQRAPAATLAFASNYTDAVTPLERLALHQRLGSLFADMATDDAAHRLADPRARDGDPIAHIPVAPLIDPATRQPRRLRVGFMSPDFLDHSVASFIEGALTHIDRARFDVLLYATHEQDDPVSRRLRALGHTWRPVQRLHDHELAARIRADTLDALVDLAGNTAVYRLPVLARRVAPVQVTAIGYPATTGTPNVDFRLGDSIADPPTCDAHFTERLVRLDPCFLCYRPHDHAQPVAPLPMLSSGRASTPGAQPGHVTFVSFNNLAKLSPRAVELFSAVLRAIPGSRLILKSHRTGDPSLAELLRGLFARHAIDPARLDVLPAAKDIASHLAAYALGDIALDTFPYHGTTTTCEALDHGLPVITLTGDVHASRVGATLLHAVGLEHLVTPAHEGTEGFVARARALAADPPALAALRAQLRPRLRASPLCDAPAYARRLADTLSTLIHQAATADTSSSPGANTHAPKPEQVTP